MSERRRRERAERHDLSLADLDELVAESLPDLDVLDVDLRLDDDALAPLVAVDGRGRLVLLLVPDEEGPGLELDALDALAYARRNLPWLARHLGSGRLRVDLEPHVVVVVPSVPPRRTVERLAPLLGRALGLFEVRRIETRGASGAYLVPIDAGPLAVAGRRSSPESFLAGLEPSRAELARLALRRLARIDDEIECLTTDDGLEWRYRGVLLALLGDARAHLEGAVPGQVDPRPITGVTDVEDLLDAGLARYVELLGAAGDDGEELEQVEIVPAEAGALLTPEEIEAFRD